MTTTTNQETTLVDPHPLLWTKDMYYAAAESGVFENRRVELIEGEIIEMSPMSSRHIAALLLALDGVRAAFGAGYIVVPQCTIDLGDMVQPEPDLAVYKGTPRDYVHEKPAHALLIVEVSDTTLASDRTKKASLYARAGIQDYWIVNLKESVVEVYRNPAADSTQAYGYGYQTATTLTNQESVSPLAMPDAHIPVASMLP